MKRTYKEVANGMEWFCTEYYFINYETSLFHGIDKAANDIVKSI